MLFWYKRREAHAYPKSYTPSCKTVDAFFTSALRHSSEFLPGRKSGVQVSKRWILSHFWRFDFLHAMAVDTVLPIGNRAKTSVPIALRPDLISKVPPSCRILSRIPLIPTPARPVDSISDRFSSDMPLPLSSTSRRTSLPEREIRTLATALQRGGECW